MENNNPKVSILIPLYNTERYVESCLRSIVNQTYSNLEIIVVNDGSTDKGPYIVNKWKEKDNRIIVINKKNEGPSKARRDGYLNATGDFICFVDSDDILPRNSIKTQIECILRLKVDLVIGKSSKKIGPFIVKPKITEPASEPRVINQPELYNDFYITFFGANIIPISVWGRLYRKSAMDKALRETKLFSDSLVFMGEDEYLNWQLFPYLQSMCFMDEIVYTYRAGGGTSGFNSHFKDLLAFSEERLMALDRIDYKKAYEPLYREYVNCFYFNAEQMLKFKKAQKETVIKYFYEEISIRRVFIDRMADFINKKRIDIKGAHFITNRDYDGMYDYANKLVDKHFGTIRSILKRSFLRALDLFY